LELNGDKFCQCVHSIPAGRQLCQRFHQLPVARKATRRSVVRRCPAGLVHLCVPIILHGKAQAQLVFGPVRTDTDRPALRLRFADGRHHRRLRRLYETMPATTPAKLQATKCLVEVLAESLARDLEQQWAGTPQENLPATVRKAQQFIRHHYLQHLTLAQIARASGVSPTHLCRQFKAATEITVFDYLHCQRIARAKELLATTDKPVTEISFDSGFASLCHFEHIFKRLTRDAPQQYRRRAKIEQLRAKSG
jgi:transcriptional regulator GlxA family with amidase domain